MTLPGKCTHSFPVSGFWVRRRQPPEEPIINSPLQNINTIIYIKWLTYCCSNLICLTSAVQLRGIDSCRHHKGAQSSLPHGEMFHTIVQNKMTIDSNLLLTFLKQLPLTLRLMCTYAVTCPCAFSYVITMEVLWLFTPTKTEKNTLLNNHLLFGESMAPCENPHNCQPNGCLGLGCIIISLPE